MRIFIWLIILFGGIQTSMAQADLERKVLALFEGEHDTVTMQYFHGRLDAMQEIGVAFACIEKDCRGVLRYIRSQEEMLLLGTLKRNEITLNEVNNFGKKSGVINATLFDDKLEGWWSNNEEEKYKPLTLFSATNIPQKATPCGKGKWIRYFSSNDQSTHILIQKSGENALMGWLYNQKKNKRFDLEGGVTRDGHFELMIFNDFDNVGSLLGSFQESGSQNILLKWSTGKSEQVQLSAKDRMIYGCIEYGDFISFYSMTYPLTRHQSFNKWMEHKVSTFTAESKKYGAVVRKENPKMNPNLRSSLNANAWTDINFISDDFISGIINFSNNWSETNQDESFIFHIKSQQFLSTKDLFINEADIESLVELEKEALEKKNNQDSNYQAWIKNEKFELVNIQYNGISFASNFHPIFGREKILLTYSTLKPFLIESAGITTLMK